MITPNACVRCREPLDPRALACGHCLALVHAEELERLAAEAAALEPGDGAAALDRWHRALALLPEAASQAAWVRGRIARLDQHAAASDLSPDGAALPFLRPQFLGSLGAFAFVAAATFGAVFGLVFAAQILVHELGHYVDIRRRGLPADMPVFLPGLGAYVRWRALGVSDRTRAEVSLAGPLAGWGAAAACAGVWWLTGDETWATLAHLGAMLNLLNLIPVWALDGGQALAAVHRAGRWTILVVCLALWPLLGQPVFVLLAGGVGYRLYLKDPAAEPCHAVTGYFAVVLALLGLVLWFLPST